MESPAGTPLSITAAYARWGGSDLTYVLQPNGRFLDFRTPRPGQSIRPGGVMKKSYMDLFFAAGSATGFYAPQGGPFNADITTWKALSDRGEPIPPEAFAAGRELTRFHSWAGLSGPSPPLLVQNGWTDDLFPAPEALRVYRTFTARPGRTHLASARGPRPPRAAEQGTLANRDHSPGRGILRRLPEARGQPAGARQRPRVHADLPRGRPRGRAFPGGELGAPPSDDADNAPTARPSS